MSDDFTASIPHQVPRKNRELKRPNTSDEPRTETNFFKGSNTHTTGLRAKSPDIATTNQATSKGTSTKESSIKDKSEKNIVPSTVVLENESDER